MDSNELVEKLRGMLAVEAPRVTVSNPDEFLAYAKELSPAFKVRLIEAMGLISQRNDHQISCVSIQGAGLICTCVRPPTVWIPPDDVLAHRHETQAERKAETEKRNYVEDYDSEDAENEFYTNSVL